MPNYDGRVEFVTLYSVTLGGRAFPHRTTFDVSVTGTITPGTPFADIPLTQKNGLEITAEQFAVDWADVWATQMGTETSQPSFELWQYEAEPSLNKTFVSAGELAAPVVFSGTAQPAHCQIYTFRSALGGVARLYFMEDRTTLETRVLASALTGTPLQVKNFLVSDNSPVVARDNEYLIAGIALNYGQNEHLRNKRFRTD